MDDKALSDDNVYAEMLKAEELETPQLLQHILLDVWANEVIPDAWGRGTIINLQNKVSLAECSNWRGITLLSIIARFSAASFSITSQQQWTYYCAKNKQASGRENRASTTSLSSARSMNSHMNGTALCMWCSWTLRWPLTAYTDHRSGRFCGTMESPKNWWTSSRPCTRTLNAESCTITRWQNLSELTPVSNMDASCHLYSSPLQWTG